MISFRLVLLLALFILPCTYSKVASATQITIRGPSLGDDSIALVVHIEAQKFSVLVQHENGTFTPLLARVGNLGLSTSDWMRTLANTSCNPHFRDDILRTIKSASESKRDLDLSESPSLSRIRESLKGMFGVYHRSEGWTYTFLCARGEMAPLGSSDTSRGGGPSD